MVDLGIRVVEIAHGVSESSAREWCDQMAQALAAR
jgi:hypothetical protein